MVSPMIFFPDSSIRYIAPEAKLLLVYLIRHFPQKTHNIKYKKEKAEFFMFIPFIFLIWGGVKYEIIHILSTIPEKR